MNQTELRQKIVEIEDDLNVFDISIDSVPIWERLRLNLFHELNRELTDNQRHTRTDFNTSSYLTGIKLWAKNVVNRNPFLSGQHEFLFYGHSRRKLVDDDKWWDIYCDPITDTEKLDYLHVERPYLMGHKTPAKTGNLRYLDFIWYSGAIRRNLGLCNVSISGESKRRLEEASRCIKQEFGVSLDLVSKAEIKLTRRKSLLDLYKRFLQKVDPTLVIVVVSSAKHTFLEACHELGITTVELQHGIIHPTHFSYAFPGDRTKTVFPKYLLTWGEFWNTNAEYPIPDENIISVGYPYLEQRRDKYDSGDETHQIVFISQGYIGEKLSKFALDVSEHPEIDHEIAYKLHPGEYDRWEDEYPWLADAEFEIIDSSEPPLYQIFSESDVQIGVGSTAVYEGLCFDLETYVYDCPESSLLSSLVGAGTAELIDSADQLASSLGTGKMLFDPEYYFESNATEQIYETLHRLAD